jgi:hypothetical protein
MTKVLRNQNENAKSTILLRFVTGEKGERERRATHIHSK